jgi:ABC-type oligopeptide transport system substrate-binding subunit
MASLSRSCARGILAALMLTSVVGAPPAVAETVLRIANMAEPESLDPHKTTLQEQINVTRNLFEGLVVLDPKGNVALAIPSRANFGLPHCKMSGNPLASYRVQICDVG